MVGDAGHHRMRARHGLAPTFVCARRETQRHRDDRRRTRHVPRPSLRANAVLVRATRRRPPPLIPTPPVDPDTSVCGSRMESARQKRGWRRGDPLGRPRSFMPTRSFTAGTNKSPRGGRLASMVGDATGATRHVRSFVPMRRRGLAPTKHADTAGWGRGSACGARRR